MGCENDSNIFKELDSPNDEKIRWPSTSAIDQIGYRIFDDLQFNDENDEDSVSDK